MHILVKFLINSIADNHKIDWNMVNRELDRITISEGEKKLIRHLETIYNVQEVVKNDNYRDPIIDPRD